MRGRADKEEGYNKLFHNRSCGREGLREREREPLMTPSNTVIII